MLRVKGCSILLAASWNEQCTVPRGMLQWVSFLNACRTPKRLVKCNSKDPRTGTIIIQSGRTQPAHGSQASMRDRACISASPSVQHDRLSNAASPREQSSAIAACEKTRTRPRRFSSQPHSHAGNANPWPNRHSPVVAAPWSRRVSLHRRRRRLFRQSAPVTSAHSITRAMRHCIRLHGASAPALPAPSGTAPSQTTDCGRTPFFAGTRRVHQTPHPQTVSAAKQELCNHSAAGPGPATSGIAPSWPSARLPETFHSEVCGRSMHPWTEIEHPRAHWPVELLEAKSEPSPYVAAQATMSEPIDGHDSSIEVRARGHSSQFLGMMLPSGPLKQS